MACWTCALDGGCCAVCLDGACCDGVPLVNQLGLCGCDKNSGLAHIWSISFAPNLSRDVQSGRSSVMSKNVSGSVVFTVACIFFGCRVILWIFQNVLSSFCTKTILTNAFCPSMFFRLNCFNSSGVNSRPLQPTKAGRNADFSLRLWVKRLLKTK